MRGLILLIIKYGGFLSFLLLEFISLLLVVNYNNDQRGIWLNSTNYFSSQAFDRFDNFVKFLNLSTVADSLAQENARLRAELRSARFQEDILEGSGSNDKWQQHYTFIAAEVINNSVHEFNNYITINKGSRHGIKPRMGVISNEGPVGVVVSVSDYYSTIMSVLHKENRIAASIKRTNAFGSLRWQGANPRIADLDEIPKHTSVQIGDTVQTNGYSAKFPGGLEIGYVEEVDLKPGSNFYEIEISLRGNLSTLKYVYVVNNLMLQQQLAAEEVKDE
ncbi:MAG: rod shape-determining protein MreC [Saprospiraceae bacterium]|nr:rod shape-determining protein MreC [Saprospiraceae bacterium]